MLFRPRQKHVVEGGGLNPQGTFEDWAGHRHNPFGLRFHPPILPYPMTFAGGLVFEGGVMDCKVLVQPYDDNPTWTEALNLWGLVVMPYVIKL